MVSIDPCDGVRDRCSTFPWLGPSFLFLGGAGDERCRNIRCRYNGTTQPALTRNIGSPPIERHNLGIVDDLENWEPYWPTQPISKHAGFIDFNGYDFAYLFPKFL